MPDPTLMALEAVLLQTYPNGRQHLIFAGIIRQSLRAKGFDIVPIESTPKPDAPCPSCGKPWDTKTCHMGGCPLGDDL